MASFSIVPRVQHESCKDAKAIKKSTVRSNDRLPALGLSIRGDYHYVNAAIGGDTKNRYLAIPLAHSSTTAVGCVCGTKIFPI